MAEAEQHKRQFLGLFVPVELLDDPRLSALEKLLLVEIDALRGDDGQGCFASNAYLGKVVGMSAGSVANAVTKMRRLGYIETLSFDGRHRRLVARLTLTDRLNLPSSSGEGSLHRPVNIGEDSKKENSESVRTRTRELPKPTIAQLEAYAQQIGFKSFDAQLFLDHYEANGWRVGKVRMRDWEATVRTWHKRESEFKPKQQGKLSYRTRQDRINELNKQKQQLMRANAPYWKIHEIDMKLNKL